MTREDWRDGDRLACKKCNRFVESINEMELCPECVEFKSEEFQND